MEKEFIPYEQALELKALGFNEECIASYTETLRFDVLEQNGIMWHTVTNEQLKEYEKACTAPLYQQAFRWFREKYKLHSTITSISQESWQWHITRPGESLGKLYDEDFYTYEEAELACLKQLIEIVKNK